MNKSTYKLSGFIFFIILLSISPKLRAQHNHGGGGRGGESRNYAGGGNSSGNYGGGGAAFLRNSGNRGDNNFRPGNNVNSIRPNSGASGSLNTSTFSPHNNNVNSRTNISINIGNRGGYGGYRSGYNSYYGSNFSYNYYPRYSYRPIYYSPYSYSHYGPLFGFRLGILPFGYYPFYLGYDPYYYYNGIYYRPYASGGYEVTAPPLGATVKHLPDGNKETTINGQQYYELGGTFYQAVYNSKNKLQYVVVGTNGVINQVDATQPIAPAKSQTNIVPLPDQQLQPQQMITTNLNQLPANTKAVTIKQQKYYMAPSGVYYQEIIGADNSISYQSVGGISAEDAPQNN